jgi:hypothetical protein
MVPRSRIPWKNLYSPTTFVTPPVSESLTFEPSALYPQLHSPAPFVTRPVSETVCLPSALASACAGAEALDVALCPVEAVPVEARPPRGDEPEMCDGGGGIATPGLRHALPRPTLSPGSRTHAYVGRSSVRIPRIALRDGEMSENQCVL